MLGATFAHDSKTILFLYPRISLLFMSNTQQLDSYVAHEKKSLAELDIEISDLRTRIRELQEEIALIRLKIPDCPCGNTMVSTHQE